MTKRKRTRKVSQPKPAQCKECDGRGFTEHEHGLVLEKCEKCDGTGWEIKASANLPSTE